MSDVTEPLQPQQELEMQGAVGEAIVLPVANDGDGAYAWSLELPDEVVEVGPTPDGRLRVRVDQGGSHVLTATLAEAEAGTPMTVLLIRVSAT